MATTITIILIIIILIAILLSIPRGSSSNTIQKRNEQSHGESMDERRAERYRIAKCNTETQNRLSNELNKKTKLLEAQLENKPALHYGNDAPRLKRSKQPRLPASVDDEIITSYPEDVPPRLK